MLKPAKKSDTILALDVTRQNVEWMCLGDPTLTTEQAIAIGINQAAHALSGIAGALIEVASALDRPSGAK